ncbi:hypothetical protein [Xenorhabdus entomophaga]|uniref:hypothetical protein n=1 Tax=Xenorhabdus entomophaga TaxID=3136257 RepID=UPI0030F3C4C3
MKMFLLMQTIYRFSRKLPYEERVVIGVFLSRSDALATVDSDRASSFDILEFDIDIKEQQVKGIKYARDLLIASYLRGFIDKPESEIRDIAKMLNGAAEQLKQEISDSWVWDNFADQWLSECAAD